MLYSAAEACACLMSRRDNAVTRLLVRNAKPGINRRTACDPKSRMPYRIINGVVPVYLSCLGTAGYMGHSGPCRNCPCESSNMLANTSVIS